jgi:hypothetical protein
MEYKEEELLKLGKIPTKTIILSVLPGITFLSSPPRYTEYLLVTDGENGLTRLV